MSSETYIIIGCAVACFPFAAAIIWLTNGWPSSDAPVRWPLLLVEQLSAMFGIAGALLLATRLPPAYGFGAFLLSNIGWLSFAGRRRHWALFVQQLCFLITSLIGLWNWWLGPLVLG